MSGTGPLLYGECNVSPYVVVGLGFDLFGVDLMFDADGVPWLLEVNNAPGIPADSSELLRSTKGPTQRNVEYSVRRCPGANRLLPEFIKGFIAQETLTLTHVRRVQIRTRHDKKCSTRCVGNTTYE